MNRVFVEQGDRIKALRKSKGLSQVALASKIGVSTTALQNWEKGRNGVLDKYLPLLAIALDTSLVNIKFGIISKDEAHWSNNNHSVDAIRDELNNVSLPKLITSIPSATPRTAKMLEKIRRSLTEERKTDLSESEYKLLSAVIDSLKEN